MLRFYSNNPILRALGLFMRNIEVMKVAVTCAALFRLHSPTTADVEASRACDAHVQTGHVESDAGSGFAVLSVVDLHHVDGQNYSQGAHYEH